MQDLEFSRVIPSDTAQGQMVQEEIIAMLEQAEFSQRDVFAMRLALEEAIVNAIKHGNRYDPSKQVKIDGKLNCDRIFLTIEDEGAGFALEEVPDPTSDERIDVPNGRGIMLMKHFLDRVEYNARGNIVTLEKARGTDDDD